MKELPDESVDLMVTSPPYNINISYGNKWKKGKAVESKGKKYDDNMPEDMYRELLKETLKETTRVLKPNGTLFINMKNRMIDDSMVAPHFIVDYVSEIM